MFELSIKGKLVVPHLHCKTSITLVSFSLSLFVLVVQPDTSAQFLSLFTNVARLMILSAVCSGLLLLFKSFVPGCKMIVFAWEVSCKPLTWWIMSFVTAPGIDFTDT